MRKALLSCLCLLNFLAVPAYSQDAAWVLLDRQQAVSSQGISFSNFVTPDYDDYIFMIDMVEPLGGFIDTMMQVTLSNGQSLVPTTYNGGVSSFMARGKYLMSRTCSNMGIPITNVKAGGYYFTGKIRLSNAAGINYGPITVSGYGSVGNATYAMIYANLAGTPSTPRPAVQTVTFVSESGNETSLINRISVSLYGLTQYSSAKPAQ